MSDDLALTARDDLALTAARFGSALRAEGVPADPGRCERFARAVTVARPTSGRALYLCALATLISSQAQIEALDRVFGAMFGSVGEPVAQLGGQRAADVPEPPRSTGDILAQAARAARMHTGEERPPEQSELPAAEQVVAEAISWAEALVVLGADRVDEAVAAQTAGVVLKYSEDLQVLRAAGFAAAASDGE